MDEIKRDSKIYKEIESFKDYELNQCIAYEACIRDSKVLQNINDVIEYFESNKKIIMDSINNIDDAACEEEGILYDMINGIPLLENSYNDKNTVSSMCKISDSRINPIINTIIRDTCIYAIHDPFDEDTSCNIIDKNESEVLYSGAVDRDYLIYEQNIVVEGAIFKTIMILKEYIV